jgi:hypothetical protein
VSRVERDPQRGRATAAKLKALGVKGTLVRAAEQGYITQLACKMPECFCPEELGGACHFDPVNAELSDWIPTLEHFPISKRGRQESRGKMPSWRTASAIASTTRFVSGVPTRAISRGLGRPVRTRSVATRKDRTPQRESSPADRSGSRGTRHVRHRNGSGRETGCDQIEAGLSPVARSSSPLSRQQLAGLAGWSRRDAWSAEGEVVWRIA